MNSSSSTKSVVAPVQVKVESPPEFYNAAGHKVDVKADPPVKPTRCCEGQPVPPTSMKYDSGKDRDSVEGEGLSIDGFMQAVVSKDKAALNVYRKVLSKSNKKLARKQDFSGRINPWNAHVAEFRKANPTMKLLKEVLKHAKATYKK